MDLSLEYIKMCEKAQEIQSLIDSEDVGGSWIGGSILYHLAPTNQSHVKDGYYHIIDEYETVKCSECGEEKDHIKHSVCTWLPRQDQLQEMIIERAKCSPCKDVALAYMFHNWMIEEDGCSFGFGKAVFPNPSMEQLWLCFVMKENFQKVWNGEEWESESSV